MGQFDVCVGVGRTAINEALVSLHRSLGPDAFTETLKSGDVELVYQLRDAPVVDFESTVDEGGVLGALSGGSSAVLVSLRFEQLSVAVESEVYSKTVTISASARCAIAIDEDGQLLL